MAGQDKGSKEDLGETPADAPCHQVLEFPQHLCSSADTFKRRAYVGVSCDFEGCVVKRNLLKFFLIFLGLVTLASCGGGAPQVSGIVAIANFETTACVKAEKTLQIRNNDSEQPQRVQGVHFEFGTNDFDTEGNRPETLKEGETYFQFFKVEEVSVGNVVKQASANMVTEVILPPGGVMNVKVSYNPKIITKGEAYHNTYLDVVLNGPKLGVMQIELRGKAATALEGCGTTQGDLRKFKVDKVTIKIKDKDAEVPDQETTDITENFQFGVDGDKALIGKADFPSIPIDTPQGAVTADLEDETFEGTFDGSKLEFPSIRLSVLGQISVEGKLTTDSVDVTAADGSLSATGSALADGKMKLVFGGELPQNPLLQQLQGGAITAEIELSEIK